MRTTNVPVTELKKVASEKGVLFIGDAVHAQPILGGNGYNDALRDGVELGEVIAKEGVEGVVSWYNRVGGRWRDGVTKSEQAIKEMHSDSNGQTASML